MQIHTCTMDNPGRSYQVNAYLVVSADGKAVLIDSGVDTEEAWKALENIIGEAGIGWQDIGHILITHGHPDHYAMTARILEHTAAKVWVHSADQGKITSGFGHMLEWRKRMLDLLVFHGMPAEMAQRIRQLDNEWWRCVRQVPAEAIQWVEDPTSLEVPGFNLQVIPTPGHSLGSCCFYLPSDNILFSGDTLLPDITPNPVVEFGDSNQQVYQSLIQMQESLLTIRRLSPARVFPGHGGPVFNTTSLIDSQLDYISARNERLLNILGDKPLNTFEIAMKLFQGVQGADNLLALSKVLGHLGWLEQRGLVRRRQMAGVVEWEGAGIP